LGANGRAVSGAQRGRPACFGSYIRPNNGATSAANKRSRAAQLRARCHIPANALSARVMACPCQSTLAATGALQRLVSPTRPPCGLAIASGAGGRGSFSSATKTANARWQPQMLQQKRTTSGQITASKTLAPCRCTLAAGAYFFVQLPAVPVQLGCRHGACGAGLSRPPALRLGALGGGWGFCSSDTARAKVLWQRERRAVGGAVSRAQRGRPRCVGSKREGRVGGAVARVEQRRPGCFGNYARPDNRTTSAANKRSREAQLRARWHMAANAPSASVMAGACQSTLAAGVPLERQVSPTRPPCGLARL
jgi:hypothetical protein